MDRRLIEHFDWVFLGLSLLISGLGVLTIYGVTFSDPPPQDYVKQIIWITIGLGVISLVIMIDYKHYVKLSVALFFIIQGVLVFLLLFGVEELGVRRWIYLPVIGQVQPSEFAKIGIILVLSWWFSRLRTNHPGFKDLLVPFALTGTTLLLILIQPDLGTSLVLIPLFAVYVFSSGFSPKKMLLITVIVLSISASAGSRILKPYQVKRITSFLNPEADPLGAGYHLIQSKIAIGSGGLIGKGFKAGTQSHLNFLPVQDTDFIFAVWAEERGYIGFLLLIMLYSLLILRALRIARHARDSAGTYLCIGFVTLIFTQIVINMGMVAGLMPITGLPLPFMSYGGTACITNFLGIGMILNVGMRRFPDYKS